MTKIREYRLRYKYTQAYLANQLHVKQSTVAMWESGKNNPRADKLKQLAHIFDCSVGDLFEDCKKGS
ncbi:MAG: helix-turn-helix transcriptional regulator [Acutalibacteraceae bacterium]